MVTLAQFAEVLRVIYEVSCPLHPCGRRWPLANPP